MPSPTYNLTLHKTYYERGFFNLGVEAERFVTRDEGAVALLLGLSGRRIEGRVTRKANLNETPRVFGGAKLRDWFIDSFQMLDLITVVVLSPTEFRLLPAD